MVKRLLLIGMVTVGLAAASAAPAQAVVSMTAIPSLLELDAAPGASGTQDISILNEGDEAFDATSVIAPYQGATEANSAESWLSVGPAAFAVEPGGEQVLSLEIEVPDDAPTGGHYAWIRVATVAGEVEEGISGATVSGELILGVLITVEDEGEGEVTHAAEIERFAPVLEPDGRIGFVAMLRNTGNIHFYATGDTQILTEDGEELAAMEFGATVPILPETERRMEGTGTLPLPPGDTYTAEASLAYEGDDPATASVTFDPADVALTIVDTSLCENLDRGPSVTLTAANGGSVGLRPIIGLTILDETGNQVGGDVGINPMLFWPGAEETTTFDLPQQYPSGSYTLMIEGQYGAEPITADVPFQVGGLAGDPIPLCEN